MTKNDERDMARGRLIRLRQEASENLQDAECRAKQHVHESDPISLDTSLSHAAGLIEIAA